MWYYQPRNQLHHKQLSLPRPKKQRQIREVILSLLMKWIEKRPHPRLGLKHQELFLWTQSLANRSSKKVTASHTCSKDLSARDPINQNTISEVAYGFGDRLRASDVNAPAKALTAIPASISVKELPRGPANNRRSNTAKVAKKTLQ